MILTKHIASASQKFGLVVIKPDGYTNTTKYPLVIFLHGIGERGDGSDGKLNMLIGGIPDTLKAWADEFNIVIVAVQSDAAFTLDEPGFALAWSISNLSVKTNQKLLTGLSWGGGGVMAFVTKSLSNAEKFSCAAPIAMTWITPVSWKFPVDAKLPIWAFHNTQDPNGGTPPSATSGSITAINLFIPLIKAEFTMFNGQTHGGWSEAYTAKKGTPLTAPNGKGLTEPDLNLAEWFLSNTDENPKSITGKYAPMSLTASAKATLNGDTVTLDGTGSYNWKSAKWSIVTVPTGVKMWDVNVVGGGSISGTAKLPKIGVYVFKLTVFPENNYAGTPATVDVTVDYASVATKTIVAELDILGMKKYTLYSDGTWQ
jgi:hypothetical protein